MVERHVGVLHVTPMEDGVLDFRSSLGYVLFWKPNFGVCILVWVVLGHGMRRILVETDCLDVCRLLQGSPHAPGISNLTKHIHEICKHEWMVSFHHVPRSDNQIADLLAKHVNGEDFDIHLFDSPPTYIVHLLQVDEEHPP
ncbi:hypothetical protein V6N12_029677 [Hibiscus sabdariffa]|uniref:RNase H type-1 domain-containing protein n=1 Tax=Hibiscus sabdariffa TaxID=183260 RepID=A0ABR2CWT6_9ROSI